MTQFLSTGLDFNIGSKQISLVPQAKIGMIAYSVIVLAYIILVYNSMSQIKSVAAKVFLAILFGIYLVLVAGVSTYNLNCTVVGSCNTFAWIIAGFMSATAIYLVWMAGVSFFMPKK